MNAAQAHEFNMWVLFLIVGLPFLCVFAGGLILHMAIALAALALFFSHPALAIALAVLWWFPWRLFWASFAIGEGLKWSNVFGTRPPYPRRRAWSRAELDRADLEYRGGAPRAVGRRPEDYNPWPGDEIDFG